MSKYTDSTRFLAGELKQNFVLLASSSINVILVTLAVVTSPIWWFPVVLLVKLVEPSEKRKRERAVREHMDRMFPPKNKE